MTAAGAAKALGIRKDVATTALRNMPDVYIDNWQEADSGPWAAVYRVIVVPKDAPHPTRRMK
jgi:hypothetical protein